MSMGKTKLYVGGLGDRITRYDLEREFERYGHLRETWVARKPPGFGFIEFEDPRDSTDAVREMDGAVVMVSLFIYLFVECTLPLVTGNEDTR